MITTIFAQWLNISSFIAPFRIGSNATENLMQAPVPTTGTFRALRIRTLSGGERKTMRDYNLPAEQISVWVRINGVDTALTATLDQSDEIAVDLVHSVRAAPGDLLSFKATKINDSGQIFMTVDFVSDLPEESIIMGTTADLNFGSVNDQYATIQGSFKVNVTSEDDVQPPCPTPGTFKKFYVVNTAAPGGGKSWVYTFRKNKASQTLTVTIADPATTGNDVAHNFAAVAGDRINMLIHPAGTPNATTTSWGAVFVPTIPGEQIFMLSGGYTDSNARSQSIIDCGLGGPSTFPNTVGGLFAPVGMTFKKLYANLLSAPGGVTNRIISLISSNLYTSQQGIRHISCTVTGAATTGNDTVGTYTVSSPYESAQIELWKTTAGNPAVGPVGIGIVATRQGRD